MAKYCVEDSEYRTFLKSAWKVPFDIEKSLPKEMAEWVTYHSTIMGVPKSYIAWPLLVAAGYCAQHTFVEVKGIHREPVLLYALVVGRSGKHVSHIFQSQCFYVR